MFDFPLSENADQQNSEHSGIFGILEFPIGISTIVEFHIEIPQQLYSIMDLLYDSHYCVI